MDTNVQYQEILKMDHDQRYGHFISAAIQQQGIWILKDQYGCVMLNTEDEDCVPVWPSKTLAEAWATDEWSDCDAEMIALKKWFSHWTPGLEEDGFALVICPMESEDGLIVYADDLEKSLRKKIQKQSK